MTALLNCPVCGAQPTIITRGGASGVRCTAPDHLLWTYGKTEAEAIAAWNRRPAVSDGWGATHRHVKRGTFYRLTGQALLQTEYPLGDEAHLLIYQDERGLLWARPSAEFNDGRFEPLPAAPSLSGGK